MRKVSYMALCIPLSLYIYIYINIYISLSLIDPLSPHPCPSVRISSLSSRLSLLSPNLASLLYPTKYLSRVHRERDPPPPPSLPPPMASISTRQSRTHARSRFARGCFGGALAPLLTPLRGPSSLGSTHRRPHPTPSRHAPTSPAPTHTTSVHSAPIPHPTPHPLARRGARAVYGGRFPPRA